MTNNLRIAWLDILRFMAIIAVIMIHVSTNFYHSAQESVHVMGTVWDSLSRWGVPIFVMISGALFLNPQKKVELKSIYSKYILRLVIAFLFWNLFYQGTIGYLIPYAKHILMDEASVPSINELFHMHHHLWFLPMMVGIYIIIPLLKAIVDHKLEVYYVILWLCFHLLTTLSILDIPFFAGINKMLDALHIKMIVGYSGYFVAGYYLSKQEFSKKQFIGAACTLIISFLLTILGTIYFNDTRLYDGLPFNVIVMSLSLFICGKYLFQNTSTDILSRPVFSENLFGVYLVHEFYVYVVFFLLESLHIDILWGGITLSYFLPPIITMCIFVLSLFSVIVIRKIPMVKYVC